MVDTIVLRILNIKKYKLLYEQFQISDAKKNKVITGYMAVNPDTGELQAKERILQRSQFYQDSGKFLPISLKFDIKSPSHNYSVRCNLRNMETNEAFLEVEYSIPKYFYGTNIFQVLGLPAHSVEAQFSMLIRTIRRFMSGTFAQMPNFEDVQIFRLDMCYNQFFSNKTEALSYLEAQRSHMAQYAVGKNMRLVPSGETTWTLLTQRYSFKVYHKGTEFEKHDARKLSDDFRSVLRGKNAKRSKYDVSQLKGIADRILRYEITFRNSMLHYLVMYYYFETPEHKPPSIVQNNMYRYIRTIFKTGGFNQFGGGENMRALSAVEFFTSKIKNFTVKSNFDKGYNEALIYEKNVTFDLSVYRLLYKFFWDKVKVSQIDSRTSVPEMKKKIEAYQERCKKRKDAGLLNKRKAKSNLTQAGNKNTARLLLPALLSQFMDLRKLKQHLPQTTYERLMLDMRVCGIAMKTSDIQIALPSLDYKDNLIYCVPLIQNVIL